MQKVSKVRICRDVRHIVSVRCVLESETSKIADRGPTLDTGSCSAYLPIWYNTNVVMTAFLIPLPT